ncbi:MAG TPA: MFS transporter [Myxococcaceae bacterium]|nr:MFS transporter [Myxococcaceae bacterium]
MSVPLSSPQGRGVLLASIVGSGMAFLDSTVVNVALPALGRALGADLAGLQWTLDAYLLTLCAFLLVGGSLGDRLGRKPMFELGVVVFAVASLLCGLAPGVVTLALARAFQGLAAALLVPLSLALVRADIDASDQGTALGLWTGLSGVTSAVGPLVGGWLVETVGWRAIFFLNLPLAAVALWAARRFLPDATGAREGKSLDLAGAVTGAVAVGGVTFALIEGPAHGWTAPAVASVVLGAASLVAFLRLERRPGAMMPLSLFRDPAFAATNGVTLLLYAALGCLLFLLMLELQMGLGLAPVTAGLTLLPATLLMLVLSPLSGRWGQARGGRWPMTLGSLIAALAFLAFLLLAPGRPWTAVLPGAVLLGLGLSLAVAPLTVAVLDAAGPERAGIASGVNNAIARLAGLLGVAAVPWAAGLAGEGRMLDPERLTAGFHRATVLCAALCLAAAVASAVWVPSRRPAGSG